MNFNFLYMSYITDRDRVKVGKQSSEEILRQLKRYQDELARRDKEVALSQGTNITATSDCVYDSKKNTGTEPIVFQCNANDSTEVSEVIITTTDENVGKWMFRSALSAQNCSCIFFYY